MKKAKSKFISLLLIVVMLLNFLPASANATVSDADAQMSTGVTTVPNPDYVEPGSVRELESRREENVEHYYDYGYDERFENAPTQIMDVQAVCSEILWELFALNVNVDVQIYTSCADECKGTVTGDNLWIPCEHSEDHLTQDAVIDDFWNYVIGNNKLVSVAWTGHLLEGYYIEMAVGGVDKMVIHMTMRDVVKLKDDEDQQDGENPENLDDPYTDDYIRQAQIYMLLHEESHAIGAIDHYCGNQHTGQWEEKCTNEYCWDCWTDAPEDAICIMYGWDSNLEYKLNNNLLDEIYCEICMGTGENSIWAHLNDHH